MKRNDLKGLAQLRLREASILLGKAEYAGAYYLAGYVVECALKACIAKQTERYEFPNKERVSQSWSHSLTGLVQIAGLQRSLTDESDADPQFGATGVLLRIGSLMLDTSVEARKRRKK